MRLRPWALRWVNGMIANHHCYARYMIATVMLSSSRWSQIGLHGRINLVRHPSRVPGNFPTLNTGHSYYGTNYLGGGALVHMPGSYSLR